MVTSIRVVFLLFYGMMSLLAATDTVAKSYTIQTVAGSDNVGDSGPALAAVFSQTEGIAVDRAGNIYIADADDNRIRKISPDGLIHTFAGTGIAGFSGDGGPAGAAQFNHPYGLAIDAVGNLFIADLGNARIREITTDGNIRTVAGSGATVPDGIGTLVPALSTKLIQPRNVAIDTDGTYYISDFGANRVYRVANGMLAALAGSGKAGFAGDGAPALLAQLNSPAGIASDSQGTIYIADSGNNLIRRVYRGVITTIYSLNAPTGVALAANGSLCIAAAHYVGTTTRATSGLTSARDVAADASGNLYATIGQVVAKATASGTVSTIAGSGAARYFGGDNGQAIAARFHNPSGIALDIAGNWYIADTANHRVRRIAPNGIVTTIAGTGVAGSAGDGGLATVAQLNSPRSVAVDLQRNIYIADTGNNRVRGISPGGVITSISGVFNDPEYVAAGPDGSLYIADAGNNRVLRVNPAGLMNTAASVMKPAAVTVDKTGNLYISEAARISKVTPAGVLSTVLDGLSSPRGLAMTADGDLLITQPGVDIVMCLSASGNLTAIAGTGTAGFSGDGGPASAALLNTPSDVAIDPNGVVWVADSGNNRMRLLSPVAAAAVTANAALVHAASLTPGPIAPGEIVTIFGSNFDPAHTQVLFDMTPATLFYTAANQINALAPSDLALNATTEVKVQVNDVTVADLPCSVVAAMPGIFTTASGTGQAAANNQDGSINSAANPADRGSIVVLYGTGGGRDMNLVGVSIGGVAAEVLYAGQAPGFPGLMQINARVPGDPAVTGATPVFVTVGNMSSQAAVTIAVR